MPKAIVESGNSQKLLKKYKNHFDSVVTDPPYHLTSIVKRFGKTNLNDKTKTGKRAREKADGYARLSRGFQGEVWDGGDIAFNKKFWRRVYRAAKPGAFLLAFGGTRTYHRMTCAIEDAGFEIRDCIFWVYSCLDEKTEILTSKGWKKYKDINENTVVVSWNRNTEKLRLQKIEDYIIQDYKGKMIKIKHNNVDQLLTPNHRVYLKPFIRKQVNYIRKGKYSDKYIVKYAKNIKIKKYLLPVSGILKDGPGLHKNKSFAKLLGWIWTDGSFDKIGTGVRIYQSSSVNLKNVNSIRKILENCKIPYKEYERHRIGYKKPNGEYNLKHKHSEITFYISGKWASYIRKLMPEKKPNYSLIWKMTKLERLAFVKAAQKGDGSKTQNVFYQNNKKSMDWLQALYSCIGYRAFYTERQDRPNNYSLYFQKNKKVEIQDKHYKKPINYKGKVWCISLKKDNAYIARRNGKVFITGNSGFPKSHNVSKKLSPKLAKKYFGWGTALKPAVEPIVVARKPISEKSVAENIKKHGTGVINIDGCRIDLLFNDNLQNGVKHKGKKLKTGSAETNWGFKAVDRQAGLGRWPANFIHDGSKQVLDLLPSDKKKKSGKFYSYPQKVYNVKGFIKGVKTVSQYNYNDAGSAARFFYCAKVTKKERNGSIHPTMKPTRLVNYLVRLVTPPGGTVLDPFAGSGTTMQAALENNVNCVVMEKTKKYVAEIKKRRKLVRQKLKGLKND